jgi:glycosyltransferase involved in cell wall biosynthesis
MAATRNSITVIVPTYRRTKDLHNCLSALDRQWLRADQVLITYRDDDAETCAYLARTDRPCQHARLLLCTVPGVVYALNKAFDEVETEFFSITDDDSVPHPDWLQRIVAHFVADPSAAGVGGKDHVFAFAENDWLDGEQPVVGIVSWYGNAIGYHHHGIGPARYVHTLKGVNISFRTSAFGNLRLDTRLRGKGAQVGWEMQLCFALLAAGHNLIYDPAVLVDHIEGPRPAEEHRVKFNPASHYDETFNRTLVMLEYLASRPNGLLRRIAYMAFLGLRGSRKFPGVLLLIHGLLTRNTEAWPRFKTTFTAYRAALAAAGRPQVIQPRDV